MAKNIIIFMKDGAKKEFPHVGRAGGSYTKTIEYKGSFAVIKDEWGNETAIPIQDIKEIKVEADYRP